jgi:hypothetical protein
LSIIIDYFQNQGFGFFKQEEICEQPVLTGVNKNFEQVFDELRRAKVLREV